MSHKRSQDETDHEDSVSTEVPPISSPTCASMPSKSIDDLPDICFLAVFKYIPLIELLRNIQLVKTRWSQLVLAELNRRRSLVIVDDRYFELSDLQLDQYQSHLIEHVRRDDGLTFTPWSRLPQLDSLNLVDRSTRYPDVDDYRSLHNQVPSEMITTLVDSLPRIRSLTVVQRFFDSSALDQIVRMIDHWRGELVSLKLYLNHEYTSNMDYRGLPNGARPEEHKAQLKARTVALFDSINQATSLKHLKLKLVNFSNYNSPFTPPPLTILFQLSTFHSNTFNDNLGDELVRYASSNDDLQIASNGSTLKCLLGINREFRDKFVYIKIEDFYNSMADDLKLFCTRFTSLVHLSITNQPMPVTELAQCLTNINQLVHLSVSVTVREEYTELAPDEIIPIPSVRLLTIFLCIRSHKTEQLHLPELFPNVEVLDLEIFFSQCPTCEYYMCMVPPGDDVLQKCAQLARRPFRHFPRLHTIQIDANDTMVSSNKKRIITKDEL